jgi:hypothetical protein
MLSVRFENGTYRLRDKDDRFHWDDITWAGDSVFCTGMIGFPLETPGAFEFRYSYRFRNGFTEWEFELSREAMQGIALGTVKELSLYGCSNPICGYKSSRQRESCPRCNLKAGALITDAHSDRVFGVCPYCNRFLRSLYARQCPHCRMDWHDADHPTTLGTR